MSPVISSWEKQQILVIAKAYPEISSKDGEIACTAGITETGKWRRIYPVPFRDLEAQTKFKKWQWIEVLAAKHTDPRPESYKIQPDSIKLLQHLDAHKHVSLRKQCISPGIFKSLHDMEEKGVTLGAFKPKEVLKLDISPYKKTKTKRQIAKMIQPSFFTKSKSDLQEKLVQCTYHFTCDDEKCRGHKIAMIDWEIYASLHKFLSHYGDSKQALAKLKEKWLVNFFHKRNTYFVAGTHRRWGKWMLIGYFSLGLYDSLEKFQQSLFVKDKAK